MNAGDDARGAKNRGALTADTAGLFLFSMGALVFYALYVGMAAGRVGYWELRYFVIHAFLLGMTYAAAMICAVTPRLRAISGAIGTGAGIASFFAISLNRSLNPLEILAGLFFSVGSLVTGDFGALLALGGFVASNILLVGSCVRHTTWRTRETTLAFFAAAIFAVGTAPLTAAVQKYETARAQVAKDEGLRVPPRIYGLQACLVRYAQASSPGAYPAKLDEINAVVPGCVDERLAAGKIVDGFRYSYTSWADAKGKQRFMLSADGVRSVGILHIAFVSDDTFALRGTDDANTPATKGRSFVSPAQFGLFLGSVRNYTVLKKKCDAGEKMQANPRPATFDSAELHYPSTLVNSRPAGYFPVSTEAYDENSFTDTTYRYRYERIEGPPENFHLSARPKQYGVTGVLSFYVDSSEIVHATAEDREPTAHDRGAPRCAYDVMSSDCESPRESVGETNAVGVAELFPPNPSGSANGAVHPGGLAKADLPKLFWRTHERNPRFLGVSGDSLLLYVTDVMTGISALRTADATPVWTLPGGIHGVVGPNEFYALSDRNGTTILERINSAGEIAWRFTATGAKNVVRAPNGTLYLSGEYLWAINENGGQVWRVELQDSFPGMPQLSADGETLYVVSTTHLFAVDTEKGRLRWRVDNPCRNLFPECGPRPLPDGKVAIESVDLEKTEPPTIRTGLRYQLRVLDAKGKTLWARDDKSTMEYVVPPATSLLVVRTNFGLEFVGASGETLRKESGRWDSLSVTRQPGVFFACSLDGLTGFESDGRQKLNIGKDKLEGTMCSGVYEGRGDLLFLESRDIYDRYSLWSVRLP